MLLVAHGRSFARKIGPKRRRRWKRSGRLKRPRAALLPRKLTEKKEVQQRCPASQARKQPPRQR